MNHKNETRQAAGRAAVRCLGALGLAAAVFLAGCATPMGLPAGSTPASTVAALGQPTAQYAMPGGGQRLQYSQAPAGQHVYNADFDASGRLVAVDDGLTYNNFNRIVLGQWTRDDVLRLLGRPGRLEYVYSFQGEVWTYRFNDMNNPRLVHVHIDPAGIVQRILFTDEFNARDRGR
ncbi:hypothetical protein [Xylophilus sp. GOD-11R]|uniref:hypothetical protein n=1 Tax=Xylophilus sp. GOD-11R TaxID=3089814 RepID=UPI00298CE086|nr:hypothetical protein [Xylophilus sp. GOD-11R]WPB57183.1 hypothetical protein R9X41_00535 [Xylophilus sp. GOD-11R]